MIRTPRRAGRGGGSPAYPAPPTLTTSPVWIAVGSVGDTGGSPTYGTNVAGDIPIMMVAGRVTAWTLPAGWSLLVGSGDFGGRRCYFAMRDTPFAGSESGSVSPGTVTGNSYGVTIHTFRSSSGAVEDASVSGSASNGNGPLPPAITSADIHRLAVFGCGGGGDGTGAHPATISATGGTWTRRYQGDTGTASNSDWSLYTFDFGASAGTITGGDGGIGINEHACAGFALVGI
jgi:hypothetical protein